jgi:hypothetical protein
MKKSLSIITDNGFFGQSFLFNDPEKIEYRRTIHTGIGHDLL